MREYAQDRRAAARRLTPEDDAFIRANWRDMTDYEMKDRLDCSVMQIMDRRGLLGLIRPSGGAPVQSTVRPYTREELAWARANLDHPEGRLILGFHEERKMRRRK